MGSTGCSVNAGQSTTEWVASLAALQQQQWHSFYVAQFGVKTETP
jgi:hypothetical protein